MKTPHVDEYHGFMIGSPHRQHWQFAILAGVAMEVALAVASILLMTAALVTGF